MMRTTIDLPDDLHALLSAVAHDRRQTLSQTTASLLRGVLASKGPPGIEIEPRSGLPVVSVGHVVTSEDVRSLDDGP